MKEPFVLGPEAMRFMGEEMSIISNTMAVINDHNAQVGEISSRLQKAVAEAREQAEKAYVALCQRTREKLKKEAQE